MTINTKWLLFDFGGCLDSDGIHSRKLFYEQFRKFNLTSDSTLFQEAYTYSDTKVINESLIVKSNLFEMNEKMCHLIAEKLNIDNAVTVHEAANSISHIQAFYLRRNKCILEKLYKNFNLGIISNFSGNLNVILEEFSLSAYFTFVLDSYYVGFSKPNPEIFKLAKIKCNIATNEICFVGDNIERDIIPAKNLGIKTVLISSKLSTSDADYTISSLEDLPLLTQTQ
jgi:putative hydrolase of the HAD superfamily